MAEKIVSQQRGELTEIVHIAPLRAGLVPDTERGKGSPPIRYVDRLREILGLYNRGEEQGFPSAIRIFRGIHTAKWALIDGDTRLLLSVVFDGGWHDYLRSLALTLPSLLHSIWSNCEGWQPVDRDPELLFDFIRRYQVATSFVYVQHPGLSVRDVDALIAQREALKSVQSPSKDCDCRALLQEATAGELAPRSWQDRQRNALNAYEGSQGQAMALQRQAFTAIVGSLYEARRFKSAFEEAFGVSYEALSRGDQS